MILLFSGGMDSYIAWHMLGKPPTIYFGLSHKYERLERSAVRRLIPSTTRDFRFDFSLCEQEDAFIPNRNAHLILGASHFDPVVAIALQKGEQDLSDRSPDFHNAMQLLLRALHGPNASLVNPVFYKTKAQMVTWYVKEGLDPLNLKSTWSCYTPIFDEEQCGACGACFRRWVALGINGIKETYAKDIRKWEGVQKYINKMKAGGYEKERTEETLKFLGEHGFKV